MVGSHITLENALLNKKLNKYSTWHKEGTSSDQLPLASKRLSEDFVSIHTDANFKLTIKDSIFTMGSCFARRLENTLHKNGFQVPMFQGMLENRDLFPTSISFNKYNTYSMLYELEWALGAQAYNFHDSCIELNSGKFEDLQLVLADFNPSDLESLLKRKEKIFSLSSHIKEAKVIVLTLGLIEAWYDNETQKYLNVTPDIKFATQHKDRFEIRILNIEENVENLNRIYKLISENNPDFNVIITVSPVPLLTTFTQNDIIVANSLSKSILISAAHTFVQKYSNVHYFPSYEIAMTSAKHVMWEDDLRHISESGAKHIVSSFVEKYVQ